jgi:hypothetical protein
MDESHVYAGNVNASSAVGAANPQTWANGDRLWLTGAYVTV